MERLGHTWGRPVGLCLKSDAAAASTLASLLPAHSLLACGKCLVVGGAVWWAEHAVQGGAGPAHAVMGGASWRRGVVAELYPRCPASVPGLALGPLSPSWFPSCPRMTVR